MGQYTDYLKNTSSYKKLLIANDYFKNLEKSIMELEEAIKPASGYTVEAMKSDVNKVKSCISNTKNGIAYIKGVLEKNASTFDNQLLLIGQNIIGKNSSDTRKEYGLFQPSLGRYREIKTTKKYLSVERDDNTGYVKANYKIDISYKYERDAFWRSIKSDTGYDILNLNGVTKSYIRSR